MPVIRMRTCRDKPAAAKAQQPLMHKLNLSLVSLSAIERQEVSINKAVDTQNMLNLFPKNLWFSLLPHQVDKLTW